MHGVHAPPLPARNGGCWRRKEVILFWLGEFSSSFGGGFPSAGAKESEGPHQSGQMRHRHRPWPTERGRRGLGVGSVVDGQGVPLFLRTNEFSQDQTSGAIHETMIF